MRQTTTDRTIYLPEPTKTAKMGWVCPKCGRSLAPWVPECHCAGLRRYDQIQPSPWIPYPQPVIPFRYEPIVWTCGEFGLNQ